MILLLITIFIVLLIYIFKKGNKNTKTVAIKHINIDKSSSIKTAPTLNVLQISDMHLENISISPEQLYESLKNEKLDLIALTGDYMDRNWMT